MVKPPKKTNEQKQKLNQTEKQQLSVEDMAAMATTLDSRGAQRNERIQQIIRERTTQK